MHKVDELTVADVEVGKNELKSSGKPKNHISFFLYPRRGFLASEILTGKTA